MKRIAGKRGRMAVSLTSLVCILALVVACLAGETKALGAAAGAPHARPAVSTPKPPTRKPGRTIAGRGADAGGAVARSAAARTAPANPGATCASGANQVAAARGRAGMVVGIDPASGELGPPSADQIQAMQRDSDPTLDRSTEGLEVITLPDGSQRVNLQGRFRSYSVLTVGADGTTRVDCVEGRGPALALARAHASPPSPMHAPHVVVGPPEE